MSEAMIDVRELSFHYEAHGFTLNIEQLSIDRGEHVAVIGSSGCGKTTLAYLIAGIFVPDRGSITVDGQVVSAMNDQRRRDFRISNIGFIFQEFELLEYLPADRNILLPYFLNRSLDLNAAVLARADALADTVGLGDKKRRLPGKLSQGEKQRIAICRALITEPGIIMADEPTGNLDAVNTAAIMKLILGQARACGTTFVMITHEHALLDRFDRVIDLQKLTRGGAR